MHIIVRYYSCDGVRMARTFKTLAGARAFAHKMVGEHPEIGGMYAASGDGIGTVRCEGATMRDLFPAAWGTQ
jgi:hypothetical protein